MHASLTNRSFFTFIIILNQMLTVGSQNEVECIGSDKYSIFKEEACEYISKL